MSLCISPL